MTRQRSIWAIRSSKPSEVPVNAKANATSPAGTAYAREIEIDSPWGPFASPPRLNGQPHAITFINDFNTLLKDLFTSEERSLATLDLEKIGAFYESNPYSREGQYRVCPHRR